MHIVEWIDLSSDQLDQAARVLQRAFEGMPAVFADASAAQAEVESFRADDERGALASVEGSEVRGWVGWIRSYSHSWELHPLAVDPAHQRRGIGTRLVAELDRRAHAAGILTLWLGTDDEHGGTNVYGVDLFPDVLAHARQLELSTRHPMAFYRKLGFEVVGLLPDVNGFGKPDILMARRVPG